MARFVVFTGLVSGARGGNITSCILRGHYSFVKTLFYSGAKAVGKEAINTGFNIITDILNR